MTLSNTRGNHRDLKLTASVTKYRSVLFVVGVILAINVLLYAKLTLLEEDEEEEAAVKVPCPKIHKSAASALSRARTEECKALIAEAACKNEAGTLHPRSLRSRCSQEKDHYVIPDRRKEPVRVVYLLTVSGRAVRQVMRLFNSIYHSDHYVLIHVDSRSDYMFRELRRLEVQFPDNVRMARRRFATIWGGTTLLQMLLHCMRELLHLTDWKWDYVLNLSESDYPVKSPTHLISYLTANNGHNFVKSHGRDHDTFVRKQGLNRTFVQCEDHLWLLGSRSLPAGIQVDGGSDWFCLHRDFVNYTVHGQDKLLAGLKEYFRFAVLPAESFFHTVLKNSRFCSTVMNNNLRLTNWKRSHGCKHQHKAANDWPGCSPNVFRPDDWDKLKKTAMRSTFFARKFEAIISQEAINMVDELLIDPDIDLDLPASHDYWENIYHYLDTSPQPKPETLTLIQSLARMHLKRVLSSSFQLEKVLEATLHNHKDIFEGVVILYAAQDLTTAVEIEVLVMPDPYSYDASDSDKSVHVSVGTDFDPKEKFFRNKFGAIGPNSDPEVLYRLQGSFPDRLTFAFLDPSGQVARVEEKHFPNRTHEGTIKSDLSKPLLPGVWSLLVTRSNDTEGRPLAKVRFPVTPLAPESVSFTEEEPAKLHSGSKTAMNQKSLKLNSQSEDISSLTGAKLKNRIVELSSEFYKVKQACLASSVIPEGGLKQSIPRCEETSWSSRSPDPKSAVGGDEKGTQL